MTLFFQGGNLQTSQNPGEFFYKTDFSRVKDVQYGVLLNSLDNCIPLAHCSYSGLFKLNRFDDYFSSIFGLWVMFFASTGKLQQSRFILAQQHSL